MSAWDTYPSDYRLNEVQAILAAVQAGECVSVIGLSGSGKSNLLGFIANRLNQGQLAANSLPAFYLVDCNRLVDFTPQAFFHLISSTLLRKPPATAADELIALEAVLDQKIAEDGQVCLLFDRFDTLMHALVEDQVRLAVAANLRALRDAYKYDLTCVLATRRALDLHTELAELFFAHTLWLGPMAENDARWNISRYAQRKGQTWDEEAVQAILKASWGYPSILRAVCEAYAAGISLEIRSLAEHPAVRRRVEEFWADQPSNEDLRLSRLLHHPLLDAARATTSIDTTQLTAKEHLLWEYFLAHPEQVCEKDDLIRAVWPEDRIYERGIRDDSLAQLIRRLREKVEPDPADPQHIHTVPGRGYHFTP
jgi:energy-coupling factor transporter ATP-binding protein EcfA2